MGIIKTFNEWVNEAMEEPGTNKEINYDDLCDEDCIIETLYQYLLQNYEPISDKNITYDNNVVEIPIVSTDEPMKIIPSGDFDDTDYIFCIECPSSLDKYIEKTTYDYLDKYDGTTRVFIYYNDKKSMCCNSAVDFLDEILELVPNPALRKK